MNDERIAELADVCVDYPDCDECQESVAGIKQALAERDREIADWLDEQADIIYNSFGQTKSALNIQKLANELRQQND